MKIQPLVDQCKRGMSWLKTSQEETPGVASSMRILLTIATMTVLTVWIWDSHKSGHLAPIPVTVTTMLGLFISGKVVQHFSEKDS